MDEEPGRLKPGIFRTRAAKAIAIQFSEADPAIVAPLPADTRPTDWLVWDTPDDYEAGLRPRIIPDRHFATIYEADTIPHRLDDVPDDQLFKELSIRHETVLMVIADSDLGEGAERARCQYSGGFLAGIGAAVFARKYIESGAEDI